MASFTIRPAVTLSEYMAVRSIRNECRDYMTRNTAELTEVDQANYWLRTRKDSTIRLVLGYWDDDIPVAFGVINGHEITGGVRLDFRGAGMGRAIFGYLTDRVPLPGSLEVYTWNRHALELYLKLGWKLDGVAKGDVTKMVLRQRVEGPVGSVMQRKEGAPASRS